MTSANAEDFMLMDLAANVGRRTHNEELIDACIDFNNLSRYIGMLMLSGEDPGKFILLHHAARLHLIRLLGLDTG